MDVKIGTRKPKLGSKDKLSTTTSGVFKLRLCGMSVHQAATGEHIFLDKYWGRKIKKEGLIDALTLFFYDGSKHILIKIGEIIRNNLVFSYMKLLQEMKVAISSCKGVKFYSSSLLFVYDAGSIKMENAVLKLIDFEGAEITENESPDFNVLEGIENLISFLKGIYEAKTPWLPSAFQ